MMGYYRRIMHFVIEFELTRTCLLIYMDNAISGLLNKTTLKCYWFMRRCICSPYPSRKTIREKWKITEHLIGSLSTICRVDVTTPS